MWYNPIMTWLLKSPFHDVLSKALMLVTVKGRKSGRQISLPANYVRNEDVLWVISKRDRTWWRNLRDGANARVLLAGKAWEGRGQVVENECAVAESLFAYFQKVPQYAKFSHIALDKSGQPVREDCTRMARDWVVIKIQLDGDLSVA